MLCSTIWYRFPRGWWFIRFSRHNHDIETLTISHKTRKHSETMIDDVTIEKKRKCFLNLSIYSTDARVNRWVCFFKDSKEFNLFFFTDIHIYRHRFSYLFEAQNYSEHPPSLDCQLWNVALYHEIYLQSLDEEKKMQKNNNGIVCIYQFELGNPFKCRQRWMSCHTAEKWTTMIAKEKENDFFLRRTIYTLL